MFYHFGLARTFLAERRDSQTAVACTSSVLLPRASLSDLRDAPAAAATQAVDAPLRRTRRLASRGGGRAEARPDDRGLMRLMRDGAAMAHHYYEPPPHHEGQTYRPLRRRPALNFLSETSRGLRAAASSGAQPRTAQGVPRSASRPAS